MEEAYQEWCKRIAESRSEEELIKHFREHVCLHFGRHNREGKISLTIWMIGVLNFMSIFAYKFPHIGVEDLLFKLCTHYKSNGGAEPPFNADDFLANYEGEIKKFHRTKQPK